jgi:hypothetical protein
VPAEDPAGPVDLLVFAQRRDARVDIDEWNAHAERFFATRLGLAEPKRYRPDAPAPVNDAARFVVAPVGSGASEAGVRAASARPRTAEDLALAEAADARAGGTGLALLARRCGMVWTIDRDSPGDLLALRLAVILASVLLGPILDRRSGALFGAATGRGMLAAALTPGR